MSPSDAALADRAHWELAASPALRQDRVTAAISHESGGQLWVVSIFLCEAIELCECISGQEQRVGKAAADVTAGPPSGVLHVLLMAAWTEMETDGGTFSFFLCLCCPPSQLHLLCEETIN